MSILTLIRSYYGLFDFPSGTMMYFSVSVFTFGEILFIGVVDLLAVTFAPHGQSDLYLGFSTFSWAIGGALASIFGSEFYTWFVRMQHPEWDWATIE